MFSQVLIRSTTCRLNYTECRRRFAILAILPPVLAITALSLAGRDGDRLKGQTVECAVHDSYRFPLSR
jgi:hypothetical protein